MLLWLLLLLIKGRCGGRLRRWQIHSRLLLLLLLLGMLPTSAP